MFWWKEITDAAMRGKVSFAVQCSASKPGVSILFRNSITFQNLIVFLGDNVPKSKGESEEKL